MPDAPAERAARECWDGLPLGTTKEQAIKAFAALLESFAAQEREACAKVADEKAHDYEGDWSSPEFNYAMDVAAAIRARKGEGA